MLCTILMAVGFRSSSALAAAYGVAVTTTMVISTLLFYVVARERWHWSRLAAGLPVGLFLVVDLAFFGANISKVLHGAWFPLVIGAVVFTLMTTWEKGRSLLADQLDQMALSFDEFQRKIADAPPQRA